MGCDKKDNVLALTLAAVIVSTHGQWCVKIYFLGIIYMRKLTVSMYLFVL